MPTTGIRELILKLPSSEIRDISEIAADVAGLIPLWFGESDEPTPTFIKQAAIDALARNETFYTANSGVPRLRQPRTQRVWPVLERAFREYGQTDLDRITATGAD